mmetsp:Transcript_29644/g.81143  ORF Transcript_29644/g.81143 Transcript_29644/m.81143 type:complete len:90 (-) Transcript_29644:383-652(-)
MAMGAGNLESYGCHVRGSGDDASAGAPPPMSTWRPPRWPLLPQSLPLFPWVAAKKELGVLRRPHPECGIGVWLGWRIECRKSGEKAARV